MVVLNLAAEQTSDVRASDALLAITEATRELRRTEMQLVLAKDDLKESEAYRLVQRLSQDVKLLRAARERALDDAIRQSPLEMPA